MVDSFQSTNGFIAITEDRKNHKKRASGQTKRTRGKNRDVKVIKIASVVARPPCQVLKPSLANKKSTLAKLIPPFNLFL